MGTHRASATWPTAVCRFQANLHFWWLWWQQVAEWSACAGCWSFGGSWVGMRTKVLENIRVIWSLKDSQSIPPMHGHSNRNALKAGKGKLKFASEERNDGVGFCSRSERVESLVQEHHKLNLPFTSCDIFAWCWELLPPLAYFWRGHCPLFHSSISWRSSGSGNQQRQGWPETLTVWWPCRRALSTTWLYIHSSRIWAGLQGHLPGQDRGWYWPSLQTAVGLCRLKSRTRLFLLFFFKEYGWIWLEKTLIECSSSKMLVASVSSFEWYNSYNWFAMIYPTLSWSFLGLLKGIRVLWQSHLIDEDSVQAAEKRRVQWHYFCCGGQAHLRT